MAAEKGAVADEYLGSGGATRSPVWCQIKADLYGKPFVVARRAGGGEGGHLLGLFALAMQAAGECAGAGALVEALLCERQVYTPDPSRHTRYQEIFAQYLRLSGLMVKNKDD